jgi:serine phosphatase RsbU (regulator of sigma subunit)
MKQRRFDFRVQWALSAVFVGVLLTSAFTFGAGRSPSIELLVGGAIVGLCIYGAAELLHGLVGCYLDDLPASVRIPARILLGILSGAIGWVAGYVIAALIISGRPHFADAFRRDARALFVIAIAITILFGALAHGYEELRRRLTASVQKLKESEFAEKELELAREIQSRLLPPPTIEGEGFTITARNLAARVVAGDFYDVLRHEDGSVGIVIADVSGKGLGASLITASVKAVLPFIANGAVDETLRKLNARLASQLGKREFVALAYARFHPATGRLQIANAGMPDPYLISNGSAEPVSVTGERLPLGARPDVRYDALEIRLEPGDRFFLVSDGIPEAVRANGEPLGYDALRDTLNAVPPGAGWIDGVLDRVRAQVQGVDDDWTAVVLERK